MIQHRSHLLVLFFILVTFFGGASFASAATIFQDDFNTGFSSLETHTPNTGTSWSKVIDNGMGLIVQSYNQHLTVVSNGSGVGSLYTASSTYSTADYEILSHVNFATAGDSNYGRWLAVRVQDASNMYALRVGGTMKIYKRVVSTWTELASTSTVPAIQNLTSPYTADWFSLRASGTTISATINGTEVLSVTDASISVAGKAGVGLGRVNTGITDTAGTGVGLDNVLVRTLEADTIVAPTTQATSVATSSVTQTAATISWTNGNGARRVAFIKAASTGIAAPENNRGYTGIRTSPTGGTQIGTSGWYAVYDGTGTSVALTNLASDTSYIVHVLEYNGDQGFEKYLADTATDNPTTFTTLPYLAPTTATTNVSAGNISGKISSVSWTSGDGANRMVFMKEGATSGEAAPINNTSYTANATFGSGTQIGTSGWYAVYSGTGSSVNVSGLDSTKSYRAHVVEYNGTSGVQKYLTTAGTNNPTNKSAYAGATLYSNYTSGNDTTGAGTIGSPYKTFHKAYSMAIDGDTLNLTGTFSWTNADETGDSTAGYTLSKQLTIVGQKAGDTIIQAHASAFTTDRRVFTITAGYTVTIRSLTLRHANIANGGGCIYNNSGGILTLQYVDIVSCRSTGSGGGGLYNSGTTTIEYSSFRSNSASAGDGAAIITTGASSALIVTNTTISGNSTATSSSAYTGGAVYIPSGKAWFTNVTMTGNESYQGAVTLEGGTAYFKNTIVANNTAVSATIVDFYRASGTFTSGGYNILGEYSTSGMATTTGDWSDSNGDATFLLSGGVTSGTLSLNATAVIDDTYGTYTHALQSGSIGIDQATTTAHSAGGTTISIPSVDQRGLARSGATDIGAYEYGGTSDSTAPTISLILPNNGATIYGSAIGMSASASDDTAVAGVKFYVNNILVGSEDTTSPYAIVWNSLSATTSGSKIVVAVARDTAGNVATSSARTVTLANQPSPSSLSYIGATTTATISWTTPIEGSSRMFFGLVNGLASSTPEQNTGTRVISHSVNLSGLPPCSVYKYYTVSKNEASEIATSTESNFKTAGCSGGATITANSENSITTAGGGTLTQGVLSLTVPTSFTSTSSEATFQAKQLDGATFFTNVTGPSGKTRAGSTVYNLSAYTDVSTTLSTFAQPITVTLSYADSDISGLDESTLKIQRYDSSVWSELSSCSVNTSANTISCTTTAFSDFGIFGDPSSSSSSSSSSPGGGGTVIGCTDRTALNYSPYAYGTNTSLCQYATFTSATTPIAAPTISIFTRDLTLEATGDDVRALQHVLIKRGHTIPAGATGYFGRQTQNALAAFQTKNNITPAVGYFGTKTRAFVNIIDTRASVEASTEPAMPSLPETTVSDVGHPTFTRGLWLKDEGSDVTALQTLLIQKGHVIRAGATGYFGEQTREALAAYQKVNGITPSSGYFGPKTRAFIANLGQ